MPGRELCEDLAPGEGLRVGDILRVERMPGPWWLVNVAGVLVHVRVGGDGHPVRVAVEYEPLVGCTYANRLAVPIHPADSGR